jgi:6-phosphofructokinase 1
MFDQIPKVAVPTLGEPEVISNLLDHFGPFTAAWVDEADTVLDPIRLSEDNTATTFQRFERSGPRARLFFEPAKVVAGIVTCGGLCPGLNNIIRGITRQLQLAYGVKRVLGFRFGYLGITPGSQHMPMELTAAGVEDINQFGGTILGSSRGPQDAKVVVDYLRLWGVNMLFCIGGDGTQRGALKIHEEAVRQGVKMAIVGVPKTIDNDVPFCARSFGFLTAVEQASEVLVGAHEEARSADYGVGLVKLMGRDAGFIAAAATNASGVVNLTLVPEADFAVEGPRGLLSYLEARLEKRRHAVIAVAEGAGQSLFNHTAVDTDASGNKKFNDIGVLLRERIVEHFSSIGKPVSMKYIDPSYAIRGVPAHAADAILCERYARDAVHAAMSGRSGMYVGYIHDEFIHVPTDLAAKHRRRINLRGSTWNAVLATTGQPAELK